MFVFSGATSTGSLDSKLRQVTYDTSSKRYPAPFGLWQRGNDGNYEYAHLQKVHNMGASYCANAAKFWGRLERERWTYAFASAVGASEHLKPPFLHLPKNSALRHANPPPRTSAVIRIDGISIPVPLPTHLPVFRLASAAGVYATYAAKSYDVDARPRRREMG
ncbi:hypothetical protein R3P38DRAFT_3172123 [Favolaschia claudopus]|uniref:Uncharacterized protein n=1 Tax=Favolaschia claudopus TaxID=2862362 RepID=A0AAW0DLC0_9AGAR